MPGPSPKTDSQALELMIAAARELFDHKLGCVREIFEQRLAAMDKALTLQAAEYNRRMEVLNNDRQEAIRVQSTYVTRESLDVFLAEYRQAHENIKSLIAERVSRELFDAFVTEYRKEHALLKDALQKDTGVFLGGYKTLMAIGGLVGSAAAIVIGVIALLRH